MNSDPTGVHGRATASWLLHLDDLYFLGPQLHDTAQACPCTLTHLYKDFDWPEPNLVVAHQTYKIPAPSCLQGPVAATLIAVLKPKTMSGSFHHLLKFCRRQRCALI